jgi:hypothetical protein
MIHWTISCQYSSCQDFISPSRIAPTRRIDEAPIMFSSMISGVSMRRLYQLLRFKTSSSSSRHPHTRASSSLTNEPSAFERLPLEIRSFEIFRHLDVTSLLNYCSTNRELVSFSRDPRTWRSLLQSNYGYTYHGSFPRQMYSLAEIVAIPTNSLYQHPTDVKTTLQYMESADEVLTMFTTVGTFGPFIKYRTAPMLTFRSPDLEIRMWMDSRGFRIGFEPTSRVYGFVLINSIYQLSTCLAQPLIKLIDNYHNYLVSHPLNRKWSKRQRQQDYKNLVAFIELQEQAIPAYISDLIHLHGPSYSTTRSSELTSTRSGRRKTVTA